MPNGENMHVKQLQKPSVSADKNPGKSEKKVAQAWMNTYIRRESGIIPTFRL